MTNEREIKSVRKVVAQQQGAHHNVGLVLEPGHWGEYDPFLLLAEDWFETGTFDIHPHRGIETVTYVIEGRLKHYDNKCGEGQLLPGDVQWMTAGRGVIHKEDPVPGDEVHSLQLWVNIPQESKMTEPFYQNLRSQDMPLRREEGATIRVFSGSSAGVKADTRNLVPVTMVEMHVESGRTVIQDIPGSYSGFIYVLEGRGIFGNNRVEAEKSDVLWLGGADKTSYSTVSVHATETLRALFYAGEPLHQPVVAYGPFVMNTQDEIRQAIQDYQTGKFGD